MKDYEVSESRLVYNGRIIDVVNDTIKLPDGRFAVREVVRHIGAACILPVMENGDIIMVRQYRHPARELVLEIPAGTLEKGEEPLSCAFRELEEETGYTSDDVSFMFSMYSAIGFCSEVLHVYIAKNLKEGKQNLDPDEFLSVERYSLKDAVGMIFTGEIKDSKTISALLAYQSMCER